MEKNISPPTGGQLTASSCFGVLFLIKGGILTYHYLGSTKWCP